MAAQGYAAGCAAGYGAQGGLDSSFAASVTVVTSFRRRHPPSLPVLEAHIGHARM